MLNNTTVISGGLVVGNIRRSVFRKRMSYAEFGTGHGNRSVLKKLEEYGRIGARRSRK